MPPPAAASAEPEAGIQLHLGPQRRIVLQRNFDEPTLRKLLSVLQPEAQP
jgi:hypothetical protein